MKLSFPEKFYWGSATSAYQVEGGIEHNDWAKAGREGKVPPVGESADHYHRYREDFDIAKSLNQNAHRFSIEWSRIEPEEGEFNQKEIEHYKEVLLALRVRGIEPFITLWHFTLPGWLIEKGGAQSKEFPKYFARYCLFVVEALGKDCKYWATINEPQIFSSLGYFSNKWPPFENSVFAYLRVNRMLVNAHNRAYHIIKEKLPNLEVGIVKHNKYFKAHNDPFNRLIAKIATAHWNHSFLKKVTFDFIGLNYYRHRSFGMRENFQKSDFGWDIYPEGIYHALMELRRYNKPVYITENGIADRKDSMRADFIKGHLTWTHKAIEEGVDVRGYFYWSLLDNYEWAEGYTMRFGLVEVDFKTKERKVRPSAQVYREICRSNMLEL